MSNSPATLRFTGAAGDIDCALDWPDGSPHGWALLLHPHPLYGGARDNKVVTTLSRACVQAGLVVVRPDFRGVGQSAGEYDQGIGEAEDMLRLPRQFLERFPQLRDTPFVLGGFSFGSAVASQVHHRRAELGAAITTLMLIGTAVERFEVAPVPEDTLVVHGEIDDTVALSGVFEWARPLAVPVVVIPGASHFFHGKLVTLKRIVQLHLQTALS